MLKNILFQKRGCLEKTASFFFEYSTKVGKVTFDAVMFFRTKTRLC